jgi:DNA polymerase III sliding clamp (beta) subunit (PCNA family)
MKVEITKLKEILNQLKPGLSGSKETTDQSNHFVFKDGNAYTYNDEVSVKVPIPFELEGAVSAKELLALVNKLKGDEADLEVSDTEILIKSGRSRAGIRLDAEILMPIDEIKYPGRKDWKSLPADFQQAVQNTLFSVSKDASFPILTVIHGVSGFMESSDTDRATKWELESELPFEILLPSYAGKSLLGYKDVSKVFVSNSWIHFNLGAGKVLSSRTFEGKFPDLSPHFENDGKELEFPHVSKEILERAGVFSEDTNDSDCFVTITVTDKGVFKVRSEGDTGWYEESLRIKHGGEEFSFSINPQYLIQILSSTHKATLSENKINFSSDKFHHVVALG